MSEAIIAVAKREIEVEKEDVVPALEAIRTLLVQSDQDQEFAADILRDIKERHAHVEGKRTEITKPLNAALRNVNNLFRPLKDALGEAERLLKGKIAAYQQSVIEQNRKQLEAAAQAETHQEAQAMMASTQPVQSPQGVNVRHVWKPRVVDATKVPRDYLAVDINKLEAHAKAAKGQPKAIPGVVFEQVPVVTSRRT